MLWTVVIPAKALPAAKSRLQAATAGPQEHRRLVDAIRADTIAAAGAATAVARVLVVVDSAYGPAGTEFLLQTRPGLNGALQDAAEHAAATWPGDAVAALVGDLPALRPAELAEALAIAASTGRGFVADAQGIGTTLLTALPGVDLAPAFGPASAERHAAGAVALDAGPGLRHDVDTPDDLVAAARVGLRPRTADVWDGIRDGAAFRGSP